jgi:hypothetical protein
MLVTFAIGTFKESGGRRAWLQLVWHPNEPSRTAAWAELKRAPAFAGAL